jgi:hypothetical protein
MDSNTQVVSYQDLGINDCCRKSCMWFPTKTKKIIIQRGTKSIESQKFREHRGRERSMSLQNMYICG